VVIGATAAKIAAKARCVLRRAQPFGKLRRGKSSTASAKCQEEKTSS
jgi:hypothetical protein